MSNVVSPPPKRARTEGGAAAPPSAAEIAHAAMMKQLKGIRKGQRQGNALATALALNTRVGTVAKTSSRISKLRKSKYANDRFAKKLALDVLCPKLRLMMHIPISETPQLTVDSGKQAVYGDLSLAYAWPTKGQIGQILYKMVKDMSYTSRNSVYKANSGTIGATNQYIPTYPDPQLLPGGSYDAVVGYSQLANETVNLTISGDEKWNQFPGLILKYWRRTYTFMNVCPSAITFQILEYTKNDLDRTNVESDPATLWAESLKETKASHGLTQTAYPYIGEANAQPAVTDLGMRPNKSMKTLNEAYRCLKASTFVIQPGQTFNHVVTLPGCYFSTRDIFQKDTSDFVPNKCKVLMFIMNGEIAFEGGDTAGTQGQTKGILGTGQGYVNWRIQSQAMFQVMPWGQPYSEGYCDETLENSVTAARPNFILNEPCVIVPAHLESTAEKVNEAGDNTAGNTDGAKL